MVVEDRAKGVPHGSGSGRDPGRDPDAVVERLAAPARRQTHCSRSSVMSRTGYDAKSAAYREAREIPREGLRAWRSVRRRGLPGG
ncbi:hypothetical protein SRB5_08730 [Streptomyces sp. RB5]|uniref:Uncharacterized protein n=1 Tax=Streptomyces smaragdinus TaxID=2585196 RepID=A0A7K0CBD0_9ACTN|nr:hypothetical protein [Streptomyces smaragdinus]